MRYRCSNCTELYTVGESTSLFPQSFCGKNCEVEGIELSRSAESFTEIIKALGMTASEEIMQPA